MICITGVPATGKTTVSGILETRGYLVADATAIASRAGCLESGTVDVDCLSRSELLRSHHAVQGHFSHLLDCSMVVILEASEEVLVERMRERGYGQEKIRENIDAQLSGTIYYEAVDRLPASRVHTIRTDNMTPEEVSDVIAGLLEEDRKR